MQFIYTDSARLELSAFQQRQQEVLEKIICDRKFVYGDEIVEITASDIREASEYIRRYQPRTTRYSVVRFASQLYMALGAAIFFGALFYPDIEKIFQENKAQAMAILTGATMIFVGAFGGYWSRIRARQEEIEKIRSRRIEHSSDKYLDKDTLL